MKLLLFGGNNVRNKEWIEQAEKNLADLFDNTYIHYYRHWTDNLDSVINFGYELETLKSLKREDEYCVFAKSAGTLLTLLAMHQKMLSPEKCFFIGFPLKFAEEHNVNTDLLLTNYTCPTLFLQQTEDPYLSFRSLEELLKLKQVKNNLNFEMPGSDHLYNEIELIRKHIVNFIG